MDQVFADVPSMGELPLPNQHAAISPAQLPMLYSTRVIACMLELMDDNLHRRVPYVLDTTQARPAPAELMAVATLYRYVCTDLTSASLLLFRATRYAEASAYADSCLRQGASLFRPVLHTLGHNPYPAAVQLDGDPAQLAFRALEHLGAAVLALAILRSGAAAAQRMLLCAQVSAMGIVSSLMAEDEEWKQHVVDVAAEVDA